MAKVMMTAEILAQRIFPGADCQIVGAAFDAARQVVVLDVAGPAVPQGDQARAVYRVDLGEPQPERIVTTTFEEF